jgi:hypothetical protein
MVIAPPRTEFQKRMAYANNERLIHLLPELHALQRRSRLTEHTGLAAENESIYNAELMLRKLNASITILPSLLCRRVQLYDWPWKN